ncbi:MAG TPA: nitroreductase family protein [Thermoanaerobaculia bacterium]|nr:nitroreductase family protein [Thermoanaerobaculia bacterium]
MTLAELAAARRTHKTFGPEPVPRETLLELLATARFAPTHHLNQPWRFRVLGPETLEALKRAAGEKEAKKLERAPTLVLATAALTGDLATDEEDVCAAAAAIQLVLLAATERGIATYWRTPHILRTKAGREAVGIPAGERFLGLLHFGTADHDPAPRERDPVERYVEFLS